MNRYAHLGFRAPPHLFSYWRVRAAWTFLLLQNPPLASRVLFPSSPSTPGDYKNCSFVYTPPESFVAAFEKADATFELKYGVGKDALIDKFLNGERTLNEEKLCCIVLSEHEEEIEGQRNYDLLICAAHFLGDGMALYRFANDFFTLLAGRPSTPKGGEDMSTKDIEAMVRAEWEFRWGVNVMTKNRGQRVLPVSVEDCLPPVNGKFKQAAAKVDFRIDQRKYIVRLLSLIFFINDLNSLIVCALRVLIGRTYVSTLGQHHASRDCANRPIRRSRDAQDFEVMQNPWRVSREFSLCALCVGLGARSCAGKRT